MRSAAVCPAHGPPDVVRIEEQPSPAVAEGQVRVRVAAAAVNFPDVLLIANEYQISVPPPFVPGSEFAGEIVETGEGTDSFAVGDRVTGTGLYRRLRPGGRGARRGTRPHSRRRRRPHRRSLRRGLPHGVSHAAIGGPSATAATSWSCSAQAAVWAWPRFSSACSSALGHRRRIVERKARCGSVLRGATSRQQPHRRPTRCAARCPARRRRRDHRPGRR